MMQPIEIIHCADNVNYVKFSRYTLLYIYASQHAPFPSPLPFLPLTNKPIKEFRKTYRGRGTICQGGVKEVGPLSTISPDPLKNVFEKGKYYIGLQD
jgi:hypothetical protein